MESAAAVKGGLELACGGDVAIRLMCPPSAACSGEAGGIVGCDGDEGVVGVGIRVT